jgi:hypothetical protein
MRRGRRWTQGFLAKRIRADKADLSDCEQGARSSAFIANHIGLIADELNLTGQQILELQSAVQADDFLLRIKKRRNDKARAENAQAFQALMILPVSEIRHWLRVVFTKNKLREQFEHDAACDPTVSDVSARINRALGEDLVDDDVLTGIRLSIADACEYARSDRKPLEEISQMFLYWARSVASLDVEHKERKNALSSIRAALADLRDPFDRVVQRHLSHALCELGQESAMCTYLAATDDDEDDAEKNLSYIVRRSADSGDGLLLTECVLKFIAVDRGRSSAPLCALDLRTTASMLAAYRDSNGHGSTALLNLRRAEELGNACTPFLRSGQPAWCQEHHCANTSPRRCQQLAHLYARRVLKELRQFLTALPKRAKAMKAAIRPAPQ